MQHLIQKTFFCAVFLILLLSIIVMADPYYWGNNKINCGTCHSAVVEKWSETTHSWAQDSLKAILGYSCLSCHNTGWDENTSNYGADEYVTEGADDSYTISDKANFNRVTNVQCETCHGPLGKEDRTFLGFAEHQEAAVIDYAAENCGVCHEESHHPTYSNWKASLHAVAKKTSIPGAFDFIASDPNCSACHTAEGFLQFIEQDEWIPNVQAPGESGHDITCAACHDPHSHETAGQLRLPKAQICVKCHNPEYNPAEIREPDGSEVHHSTAFMFEGKGGYEYGGYEYASSGHKFTVTDQCVTCHVFKTDFQQGPPEIPAYTGHTFTPQLESCVNCHQDFSPADSSFDYRGIQTQIRGLLDQLHGLLAAASSVDSTTSAFYRAKFNYDFVHSEGSDGIHNTKYAKALLESAIANFTPSDVNNQVVLIPEEYTLKQNYPNPFNPATIIEFGLPVINDVAIKIYDIRGSFITSLANQQFAAGYHKVIWNGRDSYGGLVPSGAYIYRMESQDITYSKKMIFLR